MTKFLHFWLFHYIILHPMIENLNPFYVDALWLSIAFVCGLLAKRIGLPPLVGFLVGGFLINFIGYNEGKLNSTIDAMADVGVMLLLFTIGLKLKVKSLIRPEIWGTATLHMLFTVAVFSLLMLSFSYTGLSLFTELDVTAKLMISFALSFSSTVFVVKTLEERGEMDSYHGKMAIGILIIQDIFAVLFIAFSSGQSPSYWALLLPIWLWILKIILSKLLNLLEQGEMIPVFGFFATFIAGAFTFSLVGMKPDLGALIIGMLLVNHPQANQLYDRMTEYKDFFLIAFFINVGLVGLPSLHTFISALVLLPLILFKGGLFTIILSRFAIKPRTAYLTSLSLSNFSEFGLIVGVVGLQMGLITNEWLVAMALVMSFSFIMASPFNAIAHRLFDKYKHWILKLNKQENCQDSEPKSFGDAKYVVVGMGTIGKPTYERLNEKYPGKVIGLDYDYDKIEMMKQMQLNVQWADTTDSELWDYLNITQIKAVFLTMTDFTSNIHTLEQIQRIQNRQFKIFAIAHYPNQIEKYQTHHADFVFDYKDNLGRDFVENALIEVKL